MFIFIIFYTFVSKDYNHKNHLQKNILVEFIFKDSLSLILFVNEIRTFSVQKDSLDWTTGFYYVSSPILALKIDSLFLYPATLHVSFSFNDTFRDNLSDWSLGWSQFLSNCFKHKYFPHILGSTYNYGQLSF